MKKLFATIFIFILGIFGLYQMFKTRPIIVGKSPKVTQRAFILLHGYGDTHKNFKKIAEYILNIDPRWSIILVPGQHRTNLFGYTYYSVRSGKNKEDYLKKFAKDRKNTRAIIDDEVTSLLSKGISLDKIVIGGFSEGAIVATDYILNASPKHIPANLVFMSGRVENLELEKLKHRKKTINAFISHGTNDDMVSINQSKILVRELSHNKKNKITKVFFNGNHQISQESANKLGEYLKEIK